MPFKDLIEGYDTISEREWAQRLMGAGITAIPLIGGPLSVLLAPPGQPPQEKELLCIGLYDCATMRHAAKGVSSFTDNGIGDVSVTFAAPAADANYFVSASASGLQVDCIERSANGFRLKALSGPGNLTDTEIMFFAIRI